MAAVDLLPWCGWSTSQLQIVLLGGRNSRKSSVGNLILGKEEFVTRERTTCSRRLGVVAGWWLTVVDTPGWWCDFTAQDSPRLVRREIVSSVSMCSPGPHVFLITVKASSAFSEKRRQALEEHVALLGENVWRHCIVVFTSVDKHEYTKKAEECVERGGKGLPWLIEKCGQRCHSVNLSDGSNASELLVKIQKLVADNGHGVYELQENILKATAEEKMRVEERAQLRLIRMKQHRSMMRERLRPLTDIRMVLLGAKGSGKTSALNTILGREDRQQVGRTARCEVGKGLMFGRQLTVVDTPGWWMNYFCEESPVFDRREMVLSLSLCPPGPHVFLLVVRVDRAFTETYRRAAQEHLDLISKEIWSRVILLFSFGDWLGGTTTEQYIESEGKSLGWLVEKCGNRYHVLNSKTKGDGFQVRELIGKIEELMTGWDSSWHYQIERNILEQLEAGMRRERERAEQRLAKKEKQRQMAKSQLEKLGPLTEVRLVLIGGRKTGKTSCGNTILGRESFDTDSPTTSCSEKHVTIRGKVVTVLDTPGCFSLTSDLLTPSCVLLLVVNMSSSFRDGEALERQLEVGGERAWSRAVVLFSHGDWLGDSSVEQRVESEGAPLLKLLEKCGNRYHVLDNKRWGEGAQVEELIQVAQETLAEERMAALHRGDHMWRSPSHTGRRGQKDLQEVINNSRRQPSRDLPELPTSSRPHPSAGSSQIVALRGRRAARGGSRFLTVDSDVLMSFFAAAVLSGGGLRWPEVTLPLYRSSTHEASLQVSCATPYRMLEEEEEEEDGVNVRSLCHPVLRNRTLRRLMQAGGLQALIDQWGHSSLEELEDFIDSYFEMVWEQTMEGAIEEKEEEEEEKEEEEEEVLSSIDRKLSKLELLEEIKRDLGELRGSLEESLKAVQDLRHRSQQGANDSC